MSNENQTQEEFLAEMRATSQIAKIDGVFVYKSALAGYTMKPHELRWLGNELDRLNRDLKIMENTHRTGEKSDQN